MRAHERNDSAASVQLARVGEAAPSVPPTFENKGWNPRPAYAVPPTPSKNNVSLEAFSFAATQLVQIGEGCSSRVYSGVSASSGRPIAVKIFLRDLKKKRDQEWDAREAVPDHPSLLLFEKKASVLDTNAILMELCAGKLSTYMTRNNKREVHWSKQVQSMVATVSAGLEHIHHHGFVHLDVKPDNILITGDGKFKLGDFGKMKSKVSLNDATKKNLRYGDARYAAPELFKQEPGIYWDGREDVYSLGIVTVEMMYDISPSQNEKEVPGQLLYSVDHPPALCRLVTSMLAPADRRITSSVLARQASNY